MRLLDSIYSLFDVLCMKHGVTKMETVGKTFMAASGLQGDRKDHAQALLLLGMDMIRTMSECLDYGVLGVGVGDGGGG